MHLVYCVVVVTSRRFSRVDGMNRMMIISIIMFLFLIFRDDFSYFVVVYYNLVFHTAILRSSEHWNINEPSLASHLQRNVKF
jgi:hypothetical protein